MVDKIDKQATESDAFRGKVSDLKQISVLAFSAMNQLWKSEKLCDIQIQTSTSEFMAHKIVLAAHSPYFEAMFTGQFQESKHPIINITNIPGNIMSIILDYCYTGNVDLTESTAPAVLQASNFLQITPLFESCCNILLENINSKNCLGFYTLGKLISCPKLRDKSKLYAMVNFSLVCQENEFLELDVESLVDVIQEDSLVVPNEEFVLNAIIQWLCFKEDKRASYLPEVLSHVRLGLLTPDSLKKHVETKESIPTTSLCKQLIQQAVKLLQFGDARMQCSLTRKRNTSLEEAMLVYGEHFTGETCEQERRFKLLNISVNGLVLNELKQPRRFDCLHVSQCDSFLLASHRDTIWRYDFITNEWQAIAPLNKRRFSYGLCEVDGFWYAIGGYVPGSNYHTLVFKTVERYQSSNNVWIDVAPMPTAVLSPTVVGLQGMVYVLGGETKNGITVNLVQRYDPWTNTWSVMPSFRALDCSFTACTLLQRIYLFSIGDKSPVQVYDASANVWEECPRFNHDYISGPVVINDKIYILSGDRGTEYLLECYSPAVGRWENVALFHHFRPQSIYLPLRNELPRKTHMKEECILQALGPGTAEN